MFFFFLIVSKVRHLNLTLSLCFHPGLIKVGMSNFNAGRPGGNLQCNDFSPRAEQKYALRWLNTISDASTAFAIFKKPLIPGSPYFARDQIKG